MLLFFKGDNIKDLKYIDLDIMNSKILFLIPDGIGIRNYLYSDILNRIKKQSNILFWSPLSLEAFKEVEKIHDINFEYKQITLYPEGIITRLCRESATFSRLNYNSTKVGNKTILDNWKNPVKGFKIKLLYKLSEFIGNIASKNYSYILKLEQKAKSNWSQKIIDNYKQELLLQKVTTIFITHQRVAGLMPICIAAQELGITVITVIYSWDNLPKARLAVSADKYLVWSQYMKEEFKTYYPEIPQQNILITGTPQFEFYTKDVKITREEFATKYSLASSKKWICYSGDDVLTSPNDPIYLENIASAIKNSELNNQVQIIFRRCPADFSNRFDEVLQKHQDIIISIDPIWYSAKEGWAANYPKIEDINLLVNLVAHCNLVINLGSTMAHDFAIDNKPCLYMNYDIPTTQNWSVNTIYKYQHFRSMQNLQAVGWINSKEEIVHNIIKALNNKDAVGPDRQKWLQKIVLHPLEDSSNNITQILLNTPIQ